jgi:hypothetical protein
MARPSSYCNIRPTSMGVAARPAMHTPPTRPTPATLPISMLRSMKLVRRVTIC